MQVHEYSREVKFVSARSRQSVELSLTKLAKSLISYKSWQSILVLYKHISSRGTQLLERERGEKNRRGIVEIEHIHVYCRLFGWEAVCATNTKVIEFQKRIIENVWSTIRVGYIMVDVCVRRARPIANSNTLCILLLDWTLGKKM